jgi:hypothetical protein
MEYPEIQLLPCPFCGGNNSQIRANGKMWNGGGFGAPASISIMHWCEPIDGQPSRPIERVGRDLPSAILAWNTRIKCD